MMMLDKWAGMKPEDFKKHIEGQREKENQTPAGRIAVALERIARVMEAEYYDTANPLEVEPR